MLKQTHTSRERVPREGARPDKSAEARELFQVLVACKDEADQRAVHERLTEEGRPCRLLIL